ncbi:MAG: hypothetical protein ACFCGT_16925 [Sandaracinaceae bacterium]
MAPGRGPRRPARLTYPAILAPSVARAVCARAPRLSGEARHGDAVLRGDPRRLDRERALTWLRDESYWALDLTPSRQLRAVHGSYVVGAYGPGGEQRAVARAVTDGTTFAWLAGC